MRIDIDLSRLLTKMGVVIPGIDIEYVIIKYYQLHVTKDHNTVELVNNYINNYIHHTKNKHYEYEDILSLVREKYYNTAMFKFINLLEHEIFKSIKPGFSNIKYVDLVDKDKLLVTFEITY